MRAHVKVAQRLVGEIAEGFGAPALPRQRVLVSRQAITRVASAYSRLEDRAEGAGIVWSVMASEVQTHLQLLERAGFSFEVCAEDPYPTAGAMMADVADRKIKILATASTGGHPVWSNDQNDAFRMVHDVFGHTRAARGFDRHGEEAALRSHAQMFSPMARLALYTETRGQNHAMIVASGEFQPEKIDILPGWARTLRLEPTREEFVTALEESRRFDREHGVA